MIAFTGVTKSYGGQETLHRTNVTFSGGETTVLIGPSGCGKSTMLRLINGLILPSQGRIAVGGTLLDAGSIMQIRQRMGYVIQDGGLFPHLSAEENVTLLASHLKLPEEQRKARVMELCQLTHFDTEFLSRYPSELSGGQRQRVSLMRALMMDPDILLLDEPFAALDPMVRSQLQTDLKEVFAKLKKTVVMVTHDLPEAAYFADTIVLMNNGAIVQTGNIDAFRQRPENEFVSSFIAAQRVLTSV